MEGCGNLGDPRAEIAGPGAQNPSSPPPFRFEATLGSQAWGHPGVLEPGWRGLALVPWPPGGSAGAQRAPWVSLRPSNLQLAPCPRWDATGPRHLPGPRASRLRLPPRSLARQSGPPAPPVPGSGQEQEGLPVVRGADPGSPPLSVCPSVWAHSPRGPSAFHLCATRFALPLQPRGSARDRGAGREPPGGPHYRHLLP